MNKKELIEKIENLPSLTSITSIRPYIDKKVVLGLISQLDEPETGHADEAPRYVKNILARLRELPEHDREVWLKAIMGEFEQDFSHAKWREGYEQGKFEGEYIPEKVKVSEEEAKFLETFDFSCDFDVTTALYFVSRTGWGYHLTDKDGTELKHLTREARLPKNRKRLIKAILDGYEVEKEKRYLVKLKVVDQYLVSVKSENFLGFVKSRLRSKFTRKELEEAGFGWIFSCEGIEVEEVE